MALRVLTQSEKLSLSQSDTFKEKCKQAVRDFSTYWSIHDGANLATETERITWVKNRFLAVAFVRNPIINEDPTTLTWYFLNAAKGKQYDLESAPVDVSILIDAWDTNNSFEEFVNDYFKVKGDEINFSLTGN